MTSPLSEVRALMRKYDLQAKKSWGQNFLISEAAYAAILREAVLSPRDWIVEIGAGLGTLTTRLATAVPDGGVVAIERDRDLVSILRQELGTISQIEIVSANALDFDIAAVAREHGGAITVCGNLPYQLSGRLLFRVMEFRDSVVRGVFMVQREVAERLAARVGTKEYGALTAILGAFAAIRIVTHVSPGSFVPPPTVQSSVVAIEFYRAGALPVPIDDPKHYVQVVKAAFALRRKTLRNALLSAFSADDVRRIETNSQIDLGRRGETLTVAEFADLAATLPSESGPTSGVNNA